MRNVNMILHSDRDMAVTVRVTRLVRATTGSGRQSLTHSCLAVPTPVRKVDLPLTLLESDRPPK